MASPLSASGARIQGDDYQHLFAWCQVLALEIPREDVQSVEIEAKDAGNVDDVVVKRITRAHSYCQVKYTVDGKSPLACPWWTEKDGERARSILKKFWDSWGLLSKSGTRPDMRLITNRCIDPNDPVMVLRDGRHGKLGPRLRLEKESSAAGAKRREWADHLAVREDQLLAMLEDLTLITDLGPWSLLVEAALARMGEAGLVTEGDAVERGIAATRAWVAEGIRTITTKTLGDAIDARFLRGSAKRATLLVQAIDYDPWADAATFSLDWVERYNGDSPRARRAPKDPNDWNGHFASELAFASRKLAATGLRFVFVRGAMRLPHWFAVGAELSETKGWHLAALQAGQEWQTKSQTCDLEPLLISESQLNKGSDLAIGLSVTHDVSEDALRYVQHAALAVGRFVNFSPAGGAKRDSVRGSSHAISLAVQIKRAIWTALGAAPASKIHLFVACPAGLSMMIGHVWNRMPTTQTYEDLGPGLGYTPAFLIAG